MSGCFNAGNNKFAHRCRSSLGIKMQFSNSVLKSDKRVRDILNKI